MKILFFNSDWPPNIGGIATFNFDWTINAAKNPRVDAVGVVSFKNKKPALDTDNDKIKIVDYETINFWLTGLIIGWQMLRHLRFNAFHATNLFPVGFWMVFWAKIFRRLDIVTFHGSDAGSTKSRPMVRKLKRWAIENAAHALAVSQFTRQEIIGILGIKRNDIEVFYAGIPDNLNRKLRDNDQAVEKIRKDLVINQEDFVILSVSRLVKRKGIAGIIEAISKIDNKDIILLILSSGPEERNLRRLAEDLNVQSRIRFIGRVDDVSPYYALADLAVLNSFYIKDEGDFEGLGLVLLEAQSRGLPVIGTRSGGIPEAIADGRSGFVIPERDTDSLAEKISLLATNHDLYAKMSARGIKFMNEKFNPEKNISQYLDFISK